MSSRREATRQRLFEAAITLISEQGFGATSVDQIAERAGVAKGTVYYNFSGKAELYTALMEWGVQRLSDHLSAAAVGPPREALASVLRTELEFIGTHESLARLLMAEAWRTRQTWYDTVRQIRTGAIGVISGLLEDLVEAGELPDDLDIGVAGSALFGMVLTVALDWRTLQPDRPLEEIHATLIRLVDGFLTR
ncbi:TetR/AcrR family transcriptional regulator [Nocardiopsis gilva YIM 90087]|uniref:TetR/AcrR family transcriptional regulator n=1 Tax=Nocardiopsis gilva YIM 90087 TaxID=1235441 RepID=A0A223SB41_9ACTN|nr:TetR/AcrR family transcriptional regulator [Nocardiopsis gilva]ASU85378.1 TetR/AcrR family transcriptional regulator [Nocardiopsis gilva YIM 90087]